MSCKAVKVMKKNGTKQDRNFVQDGRFIYMNNNRIHTLLGFIIVHKFWQIK